MAFAPPDNRERAVHGQVVIGVLAAPASSRWLFQHEYYPATDRERHRGGLRQRARKRAKGATARLPSTCGPAPSAVPHCGQFTAQPPKPQDRTRGASGVRVGTPTPRPTGSVDIEVRAPSARSGLRFSYRRRASDFRYALEAAAPLASTAGSTSTASLEHFAAVTAKSVTAPTVAVTPATASAAAPATTPTRAWRCATSRWRSLTDRADLRPMATAKTNYWRWQISRLMTGARHDGCPIRRA